MIAYQGEIEMSIYLTYWNYRKKCKSKLYFDNVEESKNTQAVIRRNGWTQDDDGVWHCPKEK